MITAQTQSLIEQSDALYERYAKPLEKTHRGKYIAISMTGKTLIADTVVDLMQQAKETLGPENFIFKIGSRVIGSLRYRRQIESGSSWRNSGDALRSLGKLGIQGPADLGQKHDNE
jgi:hypothetical protein